MKGQYLNAQFVRGHENIWMKKNLGYRNCQCATNLRGTEGQGLFGMQVIPVHPLFCPAVRNGTMENKPTCLYFRDLQYKRGKTISNGWFLKVSKKNKIQFSPWIHTNDLILWFLCTFYTSYFHYVFILITFLPSPCPLDTPVTISCNISIFNWCDTLTQDSKSGRITYLLKK